MRSRLFEDREHTVLNAYRRKTAEDEIWENLAACVILQACKDYDGRAVGSDGYDIDANRASAIRFLRSWYYDLLNTTGVSGEQLMQHIDVYGMPQVSTDTIIGTTRRTAEHYGKSAETSAGAV